LNNGKVYLVGAGPGDPDLISVKGVKCLKKADVILFDHLVDECLMDIAPSEAERIDVGKIAGKHTKPQEEINRLLVTKVKEGKIVVRLKGGDPFVLGRGGEEGKTLKENDIYFEVVPGITSATAVPAYAGIPVTHRGVSSSFTVITGHEDPNKETSSINWEKLTTGADTLIFLMGMGNLPEIVAKLVEHGRPASTPVAVIQNGTKPEQVTISGNLDNIVNRVLKNKLASPAIIVIGEVVGFREKLNWFENRPLFGKRILVTRASHQASILSQLLAESGAHPVELPAIDIQPIDDTSKLDQVILTLKHYQWVIFTSVNAVEPFWGRLHELKQDSRIMYGVKICAIGPSTNQELENQGIIPDFIPEIHTNEGIIDELTKAGISGHRILLPRANIADKFLVQGLRNLGALVDDIAVYRTVPVIQAMNRAKEMLSTREISVITFTSSSTVSNLVSAFDGDPVLLNSAIVACIGPKTAETATKAGLTVDIMAEKQTIPSLVASIENYFKENLEYIS